MFGPILCLLIIVAGAAGMGGFHYGASYGLKKERGRWERKLQRQARSMMAIEAEQAWASEQILTEMRKARIH